MAHDLEKKWRSQDVKLQEDLDFSALFLNDRVLLGLTKAGFKKPSPIQLAAIPVGRFGKDLLVQAKSGTGKTLVFTIVALEMLKRSVFRPQVIVVAPTREIATQICSVVKSVGCTFPKLTCFSFIGGFSVVDDKTKSITCQIVVGTPGRLKQLIDMKCLPTNSVRLLVFDEADQLIEGSFKDDIDAIFNALPQDKQVIATSATYPTRLQKILFQYLRDPHVACLNSSELALLGIVHYAKILKYFPMPTLLYKNKLEVLEGILKTIKFSQCLIFCNGIQKVEVLHRDIKKWGFSTTYISSAKEQSDRLKAIDRLKHFKCKVLVSSDLTSRGIDAENVDLVINFDLSYTIETYMHRVGRAGRYGSIGVAITLVTENEVQYLGKMEESASFKFYKLQDPVPVNLIQKPYFGEYVIEKSEPNTKQTCDEKVKADILVGNENDDALSKPGTADKMQECTSENSSCENNVSLKNENNKTSNFSEEINDIKLSENSSEDLININVKKIDSKNLNLLNDCNNVEISNSAPTEKVCASNNHEESLDLCSKDLPLSLKHQCMISIKDAGLNSKLSIDSKLNENLEKNKCFVKDSASGNVSASFENQDIKSGAEDADLTNKSESKLPDNLNCAIKSFVNSYEMNSDMKLTNWKNANELGDEGNLLRENSGKKIISASMIEDLNCRKNYYVFKAFKKYQEDKNECNNDKIGEKVNEVTSMSFQNEVLEQNSYVLNAHEEQVNADCTGLIEKSEFEINEKFPGKPNYESTPQINNECKQENRTLFFRETKPQPVQSKLIKLFRGIPEDSDSSDTDLNEVNSEVLKQSSSDNSESESSFDSSDISSSTSSSPSTSSSSEDEIDENVYRHKMFHKGKQNLSSSSSSSDSGMCREKSNSSHAQNLKSYKYPSCSLKRTYYQPLHHVVRGSCTRSSRISRGPIHLNRERHCTATHHTSETRNYEGCATSSRHHHHCYHCFLPSDHRCHPDSKRYACNHRDVCSQSYEIFYRQWMHLQNMLN